ncbi:metal ABC transporter solute-binding protein, Zn/Mn family [Holzapfeliella floricola]|uniref:Metal ABC transporter substrate-binding protein n=1 Tax=Holzapfeliella floricola DSM 23037 = JCM 16512 TaxID=1423744 RepID=A0A0R2DT52_9LACO|nr:ZinT/AdcA family metal-binding protein [Holzapfeliella floricola]KRN03660.1 metal ABC transporter substrate-binding protein [Holzapfeliella floricola DSM 23037 = JCM 16512]
MKKIHLLIISLVALLVFGAYLTEKEKTHRSLNVVATNYAVSEFAKNIAGEEATVTLVSEQDQAKSKQADVLIYQHESSDDWVMKVQKDWDNQAPKLVSGTKDTVLLAAAHDEHNHSHSHSHGDEAAHVHDLDTTIYLSPQRAMTEVTKIKEQLIAYYPDKADVFEKNASNYLEQLQQLDTDYTNAFNQAPQKSFVTQNDSFTYLALDYGLKQIKVTDIYSNVKPSASRLAELKTYVAENHIPYIYFDQLIDNDFNQTLSSEANVQAAFLNPLTQASSKDYLTLMKENLLALQKTTEIAGDAFKPEHEEVPVQTVAQGYFKDDAVKDRTLSDYAGDFQSVYPYLQNDMLDPVFDYKSKLNQTMSAAEYKDYYTVGYKTDVDHLLITGDTMAFKVGDNRYQYHYQYDGYQILNYKKGNRGVRFMFKTDDPNAGRFKYVQFSDHAIAPQQAEHFHIYFGGESQSKLLEELDNWPTYYHSDLSGLEVAQEMVAH